MIINKKQTTFLRISLMGRARAAYAVSGTEVVDKEPGIEQRDKEEEVEGWDPVD